MNTQCTLQEARTQYLALDDETAYAKGVGRQQRGFAFERVISAVLEANGLKPRAGYRPAGEQIDGSFVYHGRTYLLEAKWTAAPTPASALYAFKGKVDGKLSGTIGVFISMSGYAEDAVDALLAGKALNLILFAREDWKLCMLDSGSFKNVLEQKLRFAAEEGSPYYAVTAMAEPKQVLIITEGTLDQALINGILLRSGPLTTQAVGVASAGGTSNVVNLIKFEVERRSPNSVIAIVDNDEAGASVKRNIESERIDGVRVITAAPYLDKILEHLIERKYGSYEVYRKLSYVERRRFTEMAVSEVPLNELLTNQTVKKIIAALSASG